MGQDSVCREAITFHVAVELLHLQLFCVNKPHCGIGARDRERVDWKVEIQGHYEAGRVLYKSDALRRAGSLAALQRGLAMQLHLARYEVLPSLHTAIFIWLCLCGLAFS